ncbi:hypothetical protein ABGA94_17015, partial [Stenotrophomonas sp. 3diitr2024]
TPDVSVYAKVARGFRGPTIQGRSAVFNADFTTADSETILSWEAAIYHDSLDLSDAEQRRKAAVRLIAKVPTLSALIYRHGKGLPANGRHYRQRGPCQRFNPRAIRATASCNRGTSWV